LPASVSRGATQQFGALVYWRPYRGASCQSTSCSLTCHKKDVDALDKRGHDEREDRVNLLGCTARFEQEPSATLGFVDPVFEKACGGHISTFIAEAALSRGFAVSCLLSSRSSASISDGATKSVSLSRTRCRLPTWPIDRIAVPPILRTRSATASLPPGHAPPARRGAGDSHKMQP
jgi:hypothetical protein